MNPALEELPEKAIVKFDGELTIEHAEKFTRILREALERYDRLCLNFSEVTAVDLSFLQLICSAHRTALRANKVFHLDQHCPKVLRSAMHDAGFIREGGCSLNLSQRCIWKEGE